MSSDPRSARPLYFGIANLAQEGTVDDDPCVPEIPKAVLHTQLLDVQQAPTWSPRKELLRRLPTLIRAGKIALALRVLIAIVLRTTATCNTFLDCVIVTSEALS